MGDLKYLLPILVAVVLVWITYLIINFVYLPLNILTIYSFVFYLMIQWIIYFGHRQVLIGRVLFDYRKIKRVTYPKKTKLRFTYGQKTLETYIRFIDDSILKKSLQRTR